MDFITIYIFIQTNKEYLNDMRMNSENFEKRKYHKKIELSNIFPNKVQIIPINYKVRIPSKYQI